METIWKRYGNDMETIWKRYGNDMETIWKRYGNDIDGRAMNVAGELSTGNLYTWFDEGRGGQDYELVPSSTLPMMQLVSVAVPASITRPPVPLVPVFCVTVACRRLSTPEFT
ncbi:MAG: hypothetical protein ACI8T1_001190 [Verrucomicrobiales bacterium]|jgi:hypothetical protein